MTVEFFVNECKNGKESVFDKHINMTKYVLYETKVSDCERIVKATYWDDENKLAVNTPAKFFLFSITLFERYTDVTFSENSTKRLAEYNMLVESKLFDHFINTMRSDDWLNREYMEYSTILDMVSGDVIHNNESVIQFVKNIASEIMESISNAASESLNADEDGVDDNEVVE